MLSDTSFGCLDDWLVILGFGENLSLQNLETQMLWYWILDTRYSLCRAQYRLVLSIPGSDIRVSHYQEYLEAIPIRSISFPFFSLRVSGLRTKAVNLYYEFLKMRIELNWWMSFSTLFPWNGFRRYKSTGISPEFKESSTWLIFSEYRSWKSRRSKASSLRESEHLSLTVWVSSVRTSEYSSSVPTGSFPRRLTWFCGLLFFKVFAVDCLVSYLGSNI